MPNLVCPKCNKEFVRRVARVGLLERLFGLVYIYPFKCQLCGFRFRFMQWGVRYHRVEEDRREYDRMAMNFPVKFSGENNVEGDGTVTNISIGGCSFNTSSDVPTGTIVRMDLMVSNEVRPIVIDAAVVRTVNASRVGVEFLRHQQGERERLQLFVRGLLIGRNG